ncbi:MFS transporter [Micromonospora chokoriensis]
MIGRKGDAAGITPTPTSIGQEGDAGGITPTPTFPSAGRPALRLGLLLGMLYGPVTFGMIAAAVAVPYAAVDSAPFALVWLLSGYAIALGVGTAMFGPLTERWGTRACLRVGTALMLAGAAVCLASVQAPMVLLGRVVLALGSSAVVTVVLTIASQVGVRDRTAVSASLGAVMATCLSVATLAGGFATEVFGWRVALVLPLLSVAGVPFLARRHHRAGQTTAPIDVAGAVLLLVFVAGTVGLTQVMLLGPVPTAALVAAVVVSGTALWVRARRRVDAFVPAPLVRDRQFRRACLLAACVYGARFAVVVGAGIVLAGDGWSPVSSGVALVPCAVAGVWLGRASRRLPPARVVLLAMAALAVAAIVVPNVAGSVASLLVATVISSTAFAVGQPMLTMSLATLRTERRGTAVGLTYCVAFAGGAAGTAAVGALSSVLGASHALGVVAATALVGASVAVARRVGTDQVIRPQAHRALVMPQASPHKEAVR